jgi:hypothetical protein
MATTQPQKSKIRNFEILFSQFSKLWLLDFQEDEILYILNFKIIFESLRPKRVEQKFVSPYKIAPA